jgi:hypothetical protein
MNSYGEEQEMDVSDDRPQPIAAITHEMQLGVRGGSFRGQSVGRILPGATSAASLFACSVLLTGQPE